MTRGGYAILPTSVKYSHGRITREHSEDLLKKRGSSDGQFLLRESTKKLDDYVLSVCYRGGFHHYPIERQRDGLVKMENGSQFAGPIEVVQHHQKNRDGLLVLLTTPCERPDGKDYIVFQDVFASDLEEKIRKKAIEELGLRGQELENALGTKRKFLIDKVKVDLHKEQPWFHNEISRDEADRRMERSGHDDGKFLIRKSETRRGEKPEFRLSLSFSGSVKHYVIISEGQPPVYFIDQGAEFESLIEFVDHYYNKADGLLSALKSPCPRPKTHQPRNVLEGNWQEPDNASVGSGRKPTLPQTDQDVYDSVETTDASFNLPISALRIKEELGAGCFGSVMKGTFIDQRNRELHVAIKTLKGDDASGNAKNEILKEARIMAGLRHKNIVRLIGVCQAEAIMLVLELCPLGPLNKLVKTQHKTLSHRTLLNIMTQVAEGMVYLEKKAYVHRDLAARNVLLVNLDYAKISDFGMSKAVGADENYYIAQHAGRWPLKWYAPECVLYFKFDSKSDVWSFGVTLWECFSGGEKPYHGMKGHEIITLLKDSKRLARPANCPTQVYDLMLRCWTFDKHDRLGFTDVRNRMNELRSMF